MPHDPDTVPQHRSRIYPLSTFFPTGEKHGCGFDVMLPSERKNLLHIIRSCFLLWRKRLRKKQRGITIKNSEPEQEKPFVCTPSKNEAQKKTPVADLRSYSLRKEKHLLHIRSCFLLRNFRNRKNPCRTIPIQSRSTLHGFMLIFSPKGPPPATYSFMFSSLEKTPAQPLPPEKTAQKKTEGNNHIN